MKVIARIFSCFLLALFASTSSASLLGVDAISESHHVSGSAGYFDAIYEPDGMRVSYDQASNSPLHYRAEGKGSSWVPGYGVNEISEAWTGDYTVKAYAELGAYAIAESVYTFQPKYGSLILNMEAYTRSTHLQPRLSYSLVDLSSGEMLLFEDIEDDSQSFWDGVLDTYVQEQGGYNYGLEAFEQYSMSVNPDSIYELRLRVGAWGGDSEEITKLGFDIAAVPEPSTIFLLATGLLGLGFARRMKKPA